MDEMNCSLENSFVHCFCGLTMTRVMQNPWFSFFLPVFVRCKTQQGGANVKRKLNSFGIFTFSCNRPVLDCALPGKVLNRTKQEFYEYALSTPCAHACRHFTWIVSVFRCETRKTHIYV